MRLGFLGFGEAGSVISKALRRNGLAGAFAYDSNSRYISLGELIQRRAYDSGVELLPSNKDLVRSTDVILSVVTASSAQQAAAETATTLSPNHIFCDCNSVSPFTKTRVSQLIDGTGAMFVEAAIIAPRQRRFAACTCFDERRECSAISGRSAGLRHEDSTHGRCYRLCSRGKNVTQHCDQRAGSAVVGMHGNGRPFWLRGSGPCFARSIQSGVPTEEIIRIYDRPRLGTWRAASSRDERSGSDAARSRASGSYVRR